MDRARRGHHPADAGRSAAGLRRGVSVVRAGDGRIAVGIASVGRAPAPSRVAFAGSDFGGSGRSDAAALSSIRDDPCLLRCGERSGCAAGCAGNRSRVGEGLHRFSSARPNSRRCRRRGYHSRRLGRHPSPSRSRRPPADRRDRPLAAMACDRGVVRGTRPADRLISAGASAHRADRSVPRCRPGRRHPAALSRGPGGRHRHRTGSDRVRRRIASPWHRGTGSTRADSRRRRSRRRLGCADREDSCGADLVSRLHNRRLAAPPGRAGWSVPSCATRHRGDGGELSAERPGPGPSVCGRQRWISCVVGGGSRLEPAVGGRRRNRGPSRSSPVASRFAARAPPRLAYDGSRVAATHCGPGCGTQLRREFIRPSGTRNRADSGGRRRGCAPHRRRRCPDRAARRRVA